MVKSSKTKKENVMKKLQLLALTMLLSTPLTFVAQQAPGSNGSGTKPRATQSNRDDRQAARNARRAELQSRLADAKKARDAFVNSDTNFAAEKDAVGQTLHSQIQAVESEIENANLSADQTEAGRTALLNLHEERDTLRDRLERHKFKLQARKSMLMGHKDCVENHIADLQAEKDELQSQSDRESDGNRKDYLQGRIADVTSELADKQANLIVLQAKVDTAQKSLNALQDRKAQAKGSKIASMKNA